MRLGADVDVMPRYEPQHLKGRTVITINPEKTIELDLHLKRVDDLVQRWRNAPEPPEWTDWQKPHWTERLRDVVFFTKHARHAKR